MIKVSIIGSGYVGLVVGACLADLGMEVICIDHNKDIVELLKSGQVPIYEPGLEEIIRRNMDIKKIEFTTDIRSAIEASKVIYIAVGTPSDEDGKADLKYVMEVAKDIGSYINSYKVIVNKSTVPIGTGQRVKKMIDTILNERGEDFSYDVVSNPEFLREGTAINDFMYPDRIVLGLESKEARAIMEEVYRTYHQKGVPIVVTNIETAEMIKYASNAFLAMKITFINELANLSEKVGADIRYVAKTMGMDSRISPKFLSPGPGYGGSCFPKDTKALAKIGEECGVPLTLVNQTIIANENQKYRMVNKIRGILGTLKGKTIGVLGITYKPDTDDMREAPSLVILNELAKDGASFRIFDPKGEKEGRYRFNNIINQVLFSKNPYEAIEGADALVILTEWREFWNLDLDRIRLTMKGNYFIDLRNIYKRSLIEEKGFKYFGVGL